MIISPVFSFEDVAQDLYVTDGHIDITSEYGRGVYANAKFEEGDLLSVTREYLESNDENSEESEDD